MHSLCKQTAPSKGKNEEFVFPKRYISIKKKSQLISRFFQVYERGGRRLAILLRRALYFWTLSAKQTLQE